MKMMLVLLVALSCSHNLIASDAEAKTGTKSDHPLSIPDIMDMTTNESKASDEQFIAAYKKYINDPNYMYEFQGQRVPILSFILWNFGSPSSRDNFNLVKVIKFLLAQGADINKKDVILGKTPLMWAITQYSSILKLLLDKGAKIDMQDNQGLTALMWAVRISDAYAYLFLVQRGADTSKRNNDGNTALDLAYIQKEEFEKIIQAGNPRDFQHEDLENDENLQYGYDRAVTGLPEINRIIQSNIPVAPPAPRPFEQILNQLNAKPEACKKTEHSKSKKTAHTQTEQKKQAQWTLKHNLVVEKIEANFPQQAHNLILNEGLNVNARNSQGKTLAEIAEAVWENIKAKDTAKGKPEDPKKRSHWQELIKLLKG